MRKARPAGRHLTGKIFRSYFLSRGIFPIERQAIFRLFTFLRLHGGNIFFGETGPSHYKPGSVSTGLSEHASTIQFNRLTRPVCVVLLVFIGACRSSGPPRSVNVQTPDDFPNHSVREILDRLPERPDDFATLYAESSVSVSSPQESGNFSTRITYRESDSMLIKVRVKLGIESSRVLVTGDSTFVYDRIHNEVIVGETESIAPLLPGAVLGTDLVDAALDFIQPDGDVDWILESDTLRYHLVSPDQMLRYVVDPGIWRIVHIEHRDAEGMILEQRWYTDFRQFNQHVLPRRLQLSRPPEDTRLSMVLRRIDTQPELLNFDLGLKEDTRRIHVK